MPTLKGRSREIARLSSQAPNTIDYIARVLGTKETFRSMVTRARDLPIPKGYEHLVENRSRSEASSPEFIEEDHPRDEQGKFTNK